MDEEITQNKRKKVFFFIVAAAVLLIALIVGISIYSAPENRLQRQLDLGNRYLQEQNYEQAVLAFELAITIDDRCLKAYMGGIESYQHMNDAERQLALYDKALNVAKELDSDAIAENMDYLVQIYLLTQEIYGYDLEHATECLIEGYRLTVGNEQVKEQLIETCLKWADELVKGENYEKAISELTKGYEETQDERLKQKLKEVQEKYRQYLEWQVYMKLVDDILIRIAASCQQEDYEEVFTLMQSVEYEKLVERVDEIKETVGLQTEYGDIRLYKINSEIFGNYMIYYGDYEGDIRQGQGVWLGYYESNNYMAKGNWKEDLPQGEFIVREWFSGLAGQVVYRVISGNVDKGLLNGDVLWQFEETDGDIISFQVSFQNGKCAVLYYDDGTAIVCDKGSNGNRLGFDQNVDKDHGIVGFASVF